MILWKLLPFSRRVASVYILAICLLFLIHFKIADDFTYQHIKHYSAVRCRFGCFRNTEFYKLFSLNTHPTFYSRLKSVNNSDNYKQGNDNIILYNQHNGGKLPDINNVDSLFKRQSTSNGTTAPNGLLVRLTDYDEYKDSKNENEIINTTTTTTNTTTSTTNTTRDIGQDAVLPLYEPPAGETPVRRFPQCVIIGFTKCGTRALIEFLSLHPYIKVARNEVHFYDRDENFELGYGWYKDQMPLTYSNQVTVEKTPAYILTQRARDEMYKITPGVKLILLVRDPVVRLVSQYILRFRLHNDDEDDIKPISAIYTNFSTGKFDTDLRPVDIGNYQKHINMWLQYFPFNQMLIVNSEDLTRNPLSVVKRVETFLRIPPLFSDKNVYYNETSRFYCPTGFEPNAKPCCLGKTKGIAHPKLSPKEKVMLYDYYKPYNEKLFRLLGYRMNWTEQQWGRLEE